MDITIVTPAILGLVLTTTNIDIFKERQMKGHKSHGGMIDNRIVHDTHQEGIKRVLQRGHDKRDVEGHHGKMGGKIDKADWARKGDCLTPRKA